MTQGREFTRLPLVVMASVTFSAMPPAMLKGADWPQWRGPERTGVSHETGWSPNGADEPLWRKELGLGHASFAVSDGRLFTLGYDTERGLDVVYCLDAETGAEHWRHEYPSEIWDYSHDGGALTTPTVAGDVVYTSNREGNVFCLNGADGAVIWHRDLRTDLEVEPPEWGFAASPLLVDGTIIMNVGRVAALDALTGETQWVTDRNYGEAYSTPAPFRHDGAQRLAVLCGQGLAALDGADGSELGFHEWFHQPPIMPMTPVIVGENRIFISAGYNRGCTMLRLTDDGLEELWASRVMRNKMAGAVLHEGHLYGFDESILKCVDLEGKEQWRKRGLGAGAMSIAGGRLLIIDAKGAIVVAEATPDAFVELSRQEVLDGGTYWSTPVLSDGLVYCRNSLGSMACLDYRTGAADEAEAIAAGGPLPPAEDLIARHVEAMGGAAALNAISTLQLFGEGEYHRDAVERGSAEVCWVEGGGFAWEFESGYQYAHDGARGWVQPSRGVPTVLDEKGLEALVLGGDLLHLLDPDSHYESLRTVERTVFDDRDCLVVVGQTKHGATRRLYFDAETGLLAGSESEGEPLWTFNDYEETDGVRLPVRWSFYESELGEMRSAVFDRIEVNGDVADGAFAPSSLVAMMLRTPEEIEAANERLTSEHADLIGEWRMIDGPPQPAVIAVEKGFLTFHPPVLPDPEEMYEPDEQDRLLFIAFPFVHLQIERDETDRAVSMELMINGEFEGRMERVDED